MKTLSLALLFSGLAIAQVSISDTIRLPQGGLFAGRVEVSMPPGCSLTWNGQTYARWQANYTVTAGAFGASLIPTDAASPAGCYYIARFVPNSIFGQAQIASYTETWIVPTTDQSLKIKDLRAALPPTPSAQISLDQLPRVGNVGDCIRRTSNGYELAPCAGAAAETMYLSFPFNAASQTWTIPAASNTLGTDLIAVELFAAGGTAIEADTITISDLGAVTITWANAQPGLAIIRKDVRAYPITLSSTTALTVPLEEHGLTTIRRIVCRDSGGLVFEASPDLTARTTSISGAIVTGFDIVFNFPSAATGKCYAMGE